jgi:hypothetical protein
MAPEQPIPVPLVLKPLRPMTLALAKFATANRLPELAYFLAMAAIKAGEQSGIDAGYRVRTD